MFLRAIGRSLKLSSKAMLHRRTCLTSERTISFHTRKVHSVTNNLEFPFVPCDSDCCMRSRESEDVVKMLESGTNAFVSEFMKLLIGKIFPVVLLFLIIRYSIRRRLRILFKESLLGLQTCLKSCFGDFVYKAIKDVNMQSRIYDPLFNGKVLEHIEKDKTMKKMKDNLFLQVSLIQKISKRIIGENFHDGDKDLFIKNKTDEILKEYKVKYSTKEKNESTGISVILYSGGMDEQKVDQYLDKLILEEKEKCVFSSKLRELRNDIYEQRKTLEMHGKKDVIGKIGMESYEETFQLTFLETLSQAKRLEDTLIRISELKSVVNVIQFFEILFLKKAGLKEKLESYNRGKETEGS